MQIPSISKEETSRFAKQWTHNGVAIVLNDIHIQFATDFANIVLVSFIKDCQAKAIAAAKAAEAKLITEENV